MVTTHKLYVDRNIGVYKLNDKDSTVIIANEFKKNPTIFYKDKVVFINSLTLADLRKLEYILTIKRTEYINCVSQVYDLNNVDFDFVVRCLTDLIKPFFPKKLFKYDLSLSENAFWFNKDGGAYHFKNMRMDVIDDLILKIKTKKSLARITLPKSFKASLLLNRLNYEKEIRNFMDLKKHILVDFGDNTSNILTTELSLLKGESCQVIKNDIFLFNNIEEYLDDKQVKTFIIPYHLNNFDIYEVVTKIQSVKSPPTVIIYYSTNCDTIVSQLRSVLKIDKKLKYAFLICSDNNINNNFIFYKGRIINKSKNLDLFCDNIINFISDPKSLNTVKLKKNVK